jgi:GT2 family glycosyltransferase
MNQIAILLTCFNRKQTTLRCLEQLFLLNLNADVYLVDDHSTDGTSEAIAAQFPQVTIIQGSGNLFWSRGMHLAWQQASIKEYEYYLWLNDDVVLYENCFDELFACSRSSAQKAIVSGIVESHDKTETLYGGSDKNKKLLQPNGTLQAIRNLNGNIVLVPSAVFKVLGNLDPVYHHDLGDVDYGLRAIESGFSVVTTRVAIGSGDKNDFCRVRLPNNSLVNRFKKLYSPLGNHPSINFYFRRKHVGIMNALIYYAHIHFINILSDYAVKLIFGNRYDSNKS